MKRMARLMVWEKAVIRELRKERAHMQERVASPASR